MTPQQEAVVQQQPPPPPPVQQQQLQQQQSPPESPLQVSPHANLKFSANIRELLRSQLYIGGMVENHFKILIMYFLNV